MAYIINKTNGTTLTVVDDLTIDNTTTSLTFVGKGRKDWGEIINENFVKLLENFSNNTPPTNPLNGQLWFDTSSNSLKVYNSTTASWNTIQVNLANLSFYSQKFVTPSSGQTSGFINDNRIVGLFSDIKVSADKLDSGTLFPSVNAQTEFPNGLGPGLNLSNTVSNIYGQSQLNLGVTISNSAFNVLEIDNNLNSVLRGDLKVSGSSELKTIKVSGIDPLRPTFFLPTSAGTNGQILVSQGNNNYLKWEDAANALLNDRLIGFTGPNSVLVNASASSMGVEFYTKNTFRMILDENGNLGLDTNNPYYKIELRPNVSSNNVSIGLINDDPLIDTSINLINEFNAGNSANVNFFRRGNTGLNQADVGETIGSINWFGFNNQLYDQDVAKIRSVLTTAYPTSTVGGNIEFLTTDSSGLLHKRFEINDAGELVVYYNDGSNYYILPSSAGNTGQYLVSNSANNKLKWENIPNYEIFLSSYNILSLSFPEREIEISGISENTCYVIYVKDLTYTGISTGDNRLSFYGRQDGFTSLMPVSGHGVFSSVKFSNVVSAYTISNGHVFNVPDIVSTISYSGKIHVEILTGKKIKVAGELFSNGCSAKFTFIASNQSSSDHLIIRNFYSYTVTGTYEIYQMTNIKSPSFRF